MDQGEREKTHNVKRLGGKALAAGCAAGVFIGVPSAAVAMLAPSASAPLSAEMLLVFFGIAFLCSVGSYNVLSGLFPTLEASRFVVAVVFVAGAVMGGFLGVFIIARVLVAVFGAV